MQVKVSLVRQMLDARERASVEAWLTEVEAILNRPELVAERQRVIDDLITFGRAEFRV